MKLNKTMLMISSVLMMAAGFEVLAALPQAQDQSAPPEKLKELPPGKHALLERMTAQFGLTYDQELEIEPILHSEESVTKPLLKYTALSADEKAAIMTQIKVAARRQIRPLLTPDQQKKMDEDISYVSKNGKEPGQGGGKKSPAKSDQPVDVFADQQALSDAIQKYAALTPEEKRSITSKVKQAALSSGQLTAEQQTRIKTELADLPAPK
jgi:hypothetical protein